MQQLEQIADQIREQMEKTNAARDLAYQRSRELTRVCARSIRATHREEWDLARQLIAEARSAAQAMIEGVEKAPALYYAGYTQDALKELVEARVTLRLISHRPLPAVEEATIPLNTYLNGVCEAASELRRRCLDLLRQEAFEEAERLLDAMDAVYEVLMSIAYPDAVTRGLRRRVDQLRGVLERTRGDLTSSMQMVRLRQALKAYDHQARTD